MLMELTSALQEVDLKNNSSNTQLMTNLVPNQNLLLETNEVSQVAPFQYLATKSK